MASNTPVGPASSTGPALPSSKPANHTPAGAGASGSGADSGDLTLNPYSGANNNGGM